MSESNSPAVNELKSKSQTLEDRRAQDNSCNSKVVDDLLTG